MQPIIFAILTVVTLFAAFVVVTDRNLFHAALAMMLSFVGVAGFYIMLGAGFMAAAQLLVYIGAISILVIFAIMMTRRIMGTTEPAFNSQMIGAAVGAAGTFALVAFVIFSAWGPTGQVAAINSKPEVPQAVLDNMVVELGRRLVAADGYVLPFELASVLLLGALVGAIIVARPSGEDAE